MQETQALANSSLKLTAIPNIPMIQEGDDLGMILGDALTAAVPSLQDGDVVVITHKIISKAEGRYVTLSTVAPSMEAIDLALETKKDPALVEVILSESKKILRHRVGLIIAEHKLGMVMANAGIDQSNSPDQDGQQRVLLLPENPDRSSDEIRHALEARFQKRLAVVVTDSVGRAWRNGIVGLAIGASGLPALLDLRGRSDLDGRDLQVTQVGLADEIASAAELLMGEADEGQPVVLLQGLTWTGETMPASALIRHPDEDLFR